ncbi:hypothetical protein Pla123a_01190 [Posidoniimonas polymericola]|uniref:Uncharacterized protein n=1 Tax=Posidoniimonas polymericola TaxID=2528002 RepID=A0A5C5ZDA5_9BACT|nr:hypothetical protein [Posidoniimonas polymericola]TWT85312.1 hypothetical protein Pla123a_01190 [Posidoniimonas polymericola]
MAQAVACPRCSSQLNLPEDLPVGAQLGCPTCNAVFSPAAAKPVRPVEARVIAPAPTPRPPAPTAASRPTLRVAAGTAASDQPAAEQPNTPQPTAVQPNTVQPNTVQPNRQAAAPPRLASEPTRPEATTKPTAEPTRGEQAKPEPAKPAAPSAAAPKAATPAKKPPSDNQQTVEFPFASPALDSLSELLESNAFEKPQQPQSTQSETKLPEPKQPEAKQPEAKQPTEPKASTDKPTAEKPSLDKPGTLSDWMQRDTDPPTDESKPRAAEERQTAEKEQAAEAQAEKPAGAKTVSESSRKTQPSLESLLSSFRDNPSGAGPTKPAEASQPEPARPTPMPPKTADPKPVQQPAAQAPAPTPSSTSQPTAAFLRPAPAPPRGPQQTPSAPRPAAGQGPAPPITKPSANEQAAEQTRSTPKPTAFEDLSVEQLAAQGGPATPPQPRAAERPTDAPRPRPLTASELGRSSNSYGRSGSRAKSAAVVVASAAVGLGLGYLGLLWVAGPSGDMLGVARVLPSAVLPASFQADEPQPLTTPQSEGAIGDAATSDASADAPQEDPNIAPAGYEATVIPPRPRVASFERSSQQDSLGVERLVGAPEPYRVEQLAGVLVGADDARRTMSEKSLAVTPEAARELGSAYGKLCQVAQVLTFTDNASGSRELTALEAKELFIRLFAYGHARSDSCAMASRWLAWSQRANGGIFFAGDLIGASKAGEVYEYRLRLSPSELVAVLSDEPIDPNRFHLKNQMGVVGCVIEDPAARVQGYTGKADRAVWACHTIPLTKPRFD